MRIPQNLQSVRFNVTVKLCSVGYRLVYTLRDGGSMDCYIQNEDEMAAILDRSNITQEERTELSSGWDVDIAIDDEYFGVLDFRKTR